MFNNLVKGPAKQIKLSAQSDEKSWSTFSHIKRTFMGSCKTPLLAGVKLHKAECGSSFITNEPHKNE